VNVAAANYAVADPVKAAVFLVVRLVTPDIPPLHAHLLGANAVPIIQETVLLGVTSVGTVVRKRAPKILLRPVFKRF